MIQNVLTSIGGVGTYGVVSICIFIALFIGVAVWLLRVEKRYLKSMPLLPLQDDDPARTESAQDPNQIDP